MDSDDKKNMMIKEIIDVFPEKEKIQLKSYRNEKEDRFIFRIIFTR